MILWILSSLVLGCTGGSGKELNKNISFQNFLVLDCGRSSSKNANNPTPINSNVKKKICLFWEKIFPVATLLVGLCDPVARILEFAH